MSPATRAVPPAAFDLRPSEDRGRAVQLIDPFAEAMQPEPKPVGAERVGQQDPRAGLEVTALDAPDDVGVGQVPDLGRIAELEAVGEQHRAHRAVGEDRTVFPEHVAELPRRATAIDGKARRAVRESIVVDLPDPAPAGIIGRARGGAVATAHASAGGIHEAMIPTPPSPARVDTGRRIPHPPRDASRRSQHGDPVAAAAREGPLDLMPRAREGASHGSERSALGTTPRAFSYV